MFEIPFRNMGFRGVPHKDMVLVQPSEKCLVSLTEAPVRPLTRPLTRARRSHARFPPLASSLCSRWRTWTTCTLSECSCPTATSTSCSSSKTTANCRTASPRCPWRTWSSCRCAPLTHAPPSLVPPALTRPSPAAAAHRAAHHVHARRGVVQLEADHGGGAGRGEARRVLEGRGRGGRAQASGLAVLVHGGRRG